jgi:uncharacterized repeat protein (TIGR03803 family)
MAKFNWGLRTCGALLLWATAAVALPAQTFKTLHTFNGTDGDGPDAALVQATNGDFYGTTIEGGAGHCFRVGCGTVFKITPSGTLTTVHRFHKTDSDGPSATLVQASDGNFYGTTTYGGSSSTCGRAGCGTVFKITADGRLTTLHSFDHSDGYYPTAGLIQGTDGNLYGITDLGGGHNGGSAFKITTSGTLTLLYSFCSESNCTDGKRPAGLVQSADGNFYGTTAYGGANDGCSYGNENTCGTVFKITTSGTLTTLHSFDGIDGYLPGAGLVQATNGAFYGTTELGGANSDCPSGNENTCGTVFKITTSGKLTTLHSFDLTDGWAPTVALVQATDGNLYGTTSGGGANNDGTVFEITPGGTLTMLHSFDGTNGEGPNGLVQGTNGKFYGTTFYLGANGGDGTVFSLSVGLGPFIETNPTSGKVGAAVKILGTKLTGATSVTFNGTTAAFRVKSKSEITTMVPQGTTTGTVQVVTPGGTLSSNVPFRVTP